MTTQHDASAVERVARAMCETAPKPHWDDLHEVRKEGFRIFARAALSAMTDPDALKGWQPIETAPKDGTRIFVCGPLAGPKYSPEGMAWSRGIVAAQEVVIAFYEGGRWQTGAYQVPENPTHWQPLPDPPAIRNLGDR